MTPGRTPGRGGAAAWALAFALLSSQAPAAVKAATAARGSTTYFISPTGSDGASGLEDSPWRTFAKAWQSVVSGDTIMVGDGTYTDASPPAGKSGLASLPITVRAANPGRARLGALSFKGNAHLAFVGFRIEGDDYAVAVGSNGPGRPSNHLTFRQIGFSCVPNTLNNGACFTLYDGTHHVLLEDSWGWGGGRYTVKCYGGPGGRPPNLTCDHNTFRRVVLRMGPAKSTPGNPQAALSLYYSSDNLVENVIAIDGKAQSDTSNSAFYVTAHQPPPNSNRNRFLGVIALNNLGAGFWLDCPGAVCTDVEVRGSVFWGSSGSSVYIQGGTCAGAIFDGNTMGYAGRGSGYGNHKCDDATLTNNALYKNERFGARQSPDGGSTPTAHHNGYFGNRAGARERVRLGEGDLASDPGLRYITRIEASSPYAKAGTSGNIGASVLNRFENGQLTATPLWPWPFEERLRSEMCAGEPSPGFCASGKTLTRYVWEYLGNPLPAGIYR